MSLLIPNPSNQVVSGILSVGFQSGVANTVFIGSSGSWGGAGASVNDFNSDDYSVEDRRLLVDAALRAWNFQQDELNRLQVLSVSSGNLTTSIPTSGHPLFTASVIVGAQGSDNIVGVFGADDDDMFERDALLQTAGRAYGLANEHGQSGKTWVRIGATASGKGISGIAHKLAVAFSGDIVHIGGQGTQPPAETITVSGENIDVLSTAAIMYGWIEGQSNIERVRVTASGKGISGIPHALVVAPAIYDPSGKQWLDNWSINSGKQWMGVAIRDDSNPTLKAQVLTAEPFNNIVADDAGLTTIAATYGWNQETSGWHGVSVAPVVSGKGYALVVTPPEPPTYTIKTGTVIPASGGAGGALCFAMFPPSPTTTPNKAIKIRDVRIINVDTDIISGQSIRFTLYKLYSNISGGTVTTAISHDYRNPESGVAINMRLEPNSDGVSTDKLRTITTTTRGIVAGEAAMTSGVATSFIPPHLLESMNLADFGQGIQPITCLEDEGFAIGQDSLGTKVNSGKFIFNITYTVQDEVVV